MSEFPGKGWASPVFQLARSKTLAIPMSLHEAARTKLVSILKSKGNSGIVILQGGDDSCQYDSDTENIFRQDSWFNYLFGVKESGVFGAICLSTSSATLFIPKLPDEFQMWCGTIHPPNHFKESYAVDSVEYTDSLSAWLDQALLSEGGDLFVLEGVNSDSGSTSKSATFTGIEDIRSKFKIDNSALHHALSTARVTKSPYEIEVMRYCAYVASNAHVQIMRSTSAGMHEYELEARFMYEIYKNGGCRRAAYTSICACGPNAAVLHYGHAGAPNDRQLLPTDMALLDMGAEYHGYVSDITCSFPVSGKFSEDQKAIYTGVLSAQIAVLEAMKPGASWVDCHRIAELEIIKALVNVGILTLTLSTEGMEVSFETLAELGLGAVFFPHGLGHLIGCDTHDAGGYLQGTPSRPTQPGLKKLRTARVLEEGMVLTNEPGCYFIRYLIQEALRDPIKSAYINAEVLARFEDFGGVRLEDVVVVTASGAENLTTCPRTIDEVESVMGGAAWPPALDTACDLKRRFDYKFDGDRMVKV